MKKSSLFLTVCVLLIFAEAGLCVENSIANDRLQLSFERNGQFILKRVTDGALLLFPGSTSYLSVEIDGTVYSHIDGTLPAAGDPSILGTDCAIFTFDLPNDVKVDQILTIQNGVVEIKYSAYNRSSDNRKVRIRILLDTQIDINDGSPLYGTGIGLQISERSFSPGLSSWRSYDAWPTYRVQSICTYTATPDLVLFAFWPTAKQSKWTYAIEPNRRFFTPGKTKSGDGSDSCVLSYFDLGTIAPSQRREISFYYGEEAPQIKQGKEGVQIALQKLEQSFLDKIESDLRLLAKYHARSFKAIFNSTDLRGNLYNAQGMKNEVINTVVKAVHISAQDMLGQSTSAVSSLLTAPLTLGANAVIDGLEQKNAIDYYAQLFYKYFDGGCNPDMSDSDLENCIYNVLAEDSGIDIKERQRIIKERFEELYQQCDNTTAEFETDGLIKSINRLSADLERARFQEITALWPSIDQRTIRFGKLGSIRTYSQLSLDATTMDRSQKPIKLVGYVTAAGVGLVKGVLVVFSSGASIPAEIVTGVGVGLLIKTVIDLSVNQIDLYTDAASGVVAVLSLSCFCDSEFLNTEKAVLETLDFSKSVLQNPQDFSFASNIVIEEVAVNDVAVNDENKLVKAKGYIKLKNQKSTASRVSVFSEVLGPPSVNQCPISLMNHETYLLQPNSQRIIELNLEVPSMKVWSQCREYIVKTWVAGDYGDVVMNLTEFAVGSEQAIAALDQTNRQTLLEGVITEGNIKKTSYTIATNSGGALFYIICEGSDVDIHLYDASGRHVGLNYATGLIENQIPGVTYSGSNTENEWISVEGHKGESLELTAVGVDVAVPERFIVIGSEKPGKVPALLSVSASPLVINPKNKSNFRASLIVAEYGGKCGINDLAIRVKNDMTDFKPYGLEIDVPQTNINPGSFVECSLSLPQTNSRFGNQLVLMVGGRDSKSGALLTSDIVISLPEAKEMNYLPLFVTLFLLVLIALIIAVVLLVFKSAESGSKRLPSHLHYHLMVKGRTVPLSYINTRIGRREDNDIVLMSPRVSGIHAEIRMDRSGFILRDLGSKNGTFLNGKRIIFTNLHIGDVFDICGYKFTFKVNA